MTRIATLFTVALLGLAGLVAADDGAEDPGDGTHSGSASQSGSHTGTSSSSPPPSNPPPASESDAEARECLREAGNDTAARAECKREFCRDHPGADACKSAQDGSDDEESEVGSRIRAWCRDEDRSDREIARCRSLTEFREGRDDDHWVTFRTEDGFHGILDYRIGGWLAISSIAIDVNGTLNVERVGRTLRVGDNDTELILHDNPTGLVRFKGSDGNVTLVFPAGAILEQGEHGARVVYGAGQPPKIGHLVADNATWLANQTVVLSGFFAFHMPARGDAASGSDGDETEHEAEVNDGVQEARERGHIGAEVTVNGPSSDAEMAASVEPDQEVEVLAYDDIEVDVNVPEQATVDDPIRIEVTAHLDEGRTIVLNLDETLLPSDNADDLVLRYFDINNSTAGEVETEVVFLAASSLQDILDPTDDGGQPEYWVVTDANGVQVLVSVPRWSTHAITVASIANVVSQPSVIVGIILGATFSIMAAAGIFWPRKGEDDDF